MKKNIFLIVCSLFSVSFYAQLLRYNFDERGDTYIQGSFRGQFWARYLDTNPGTTIGGEAVNQSVDFSVRRYRVGFQAQINKKLYFFLLMGNNNINQKTVRSSDFRLLDILAEYTFSPKLKLGAGKLIFAGPGRYVYFSNGSMMNLDPAIHQLFTINHYDDVGRNVGMYAKGQLGKLEYNVNVQSVAMPTDIHIKSFGYSKKHATLGYASYFKYEFFDDESNRSPYSGGIGTYIGAKKVLNLGMGYAFKSKMFEKLVGTEVTYDNYRNLGVDLFIDMPISEKNAAITTYLAFNNINLGEKNVRNIAVNSIFDAEGTSFNEGGNAYPIVGTGNSIMFQFGYLLPKSENHKVRFQPNFGWKFADYKGLNQAVNVYDLGLNIFFNGHKSKLSLGYNSRPIFDKSEKKVSTRKGMFVAQYQIEL
ncbi:MAG: hypothetical protein Q4A09_08300 [Capnocytophaga felis]|nr:hypothetical protein [Capnocytophaga felis]